MYLSKGSIKPVAIGLSVLTLAALIKGILILAVPLAIAAVVFWIATKNETLMLKLTTPKQIISNEAKDVEMFAANPRYRAMVIQKLKEQENKLYDRRVTEARSVYNNLVSQRRSRVDYLRNGRWVSVSQIGVNEQLGQVMINNNPYYYSSIKGAEVVTVYSQRIEQYEIKDEEEKRKPSVGGAVVGGLVGGVVGAAVGAAVFSKKTTSGGKTVQGNHIPTCTHIGVKVNLDGFGYEIPILNHTVDQGTPEFANAMAEAAMLVDRLRILSTTPIPIHTTVPEENPEILSLDAQISNAEQKVQAAIATVPTYELPARYSRVVNSSDPVPQSRSNEIAYCPDCGAPATGKFCTKCGRRLQ